MSCKIKTHFIFLFIFVVLVSCSESKEIENPEQHLLNVFKMELALVEDYQDDYIGYMKQQVVFFKKKTRLASEAIAVINEKYKEMSSVEQVEYERNWRKQFQPIVNEIHEETRKMIANQTAHLSTGKRAVIQELAIKLEILEKETESVKLVPKFYYSIIE